MHLESNNFGDPVQFKHISDVFESTLFIRSTTKEEISLNDVNQVTTELDGFEELSKQLLQKVENSIGMLDDLSNLEWTQKVPPLLAGLEMVMDCYEYLTEKMELTNQRLVSYLERISPYKKVNEKILEINRKLLRAVYVTKGIAGDTYKALVHLRTGVLIEQANRESDQASPLFSNAQDALHFLRNA